MIQVGHCAVQCSLFRMSRIFFFSRGEDSRLHPMFTLAIDMGATQCVSSKRQAWPSPAAAYPKILGQDRAFQHGFHPSIIQRDISTHTQTYKKKEAKSHAHTTNLTGPHRDKRTAGSESINNTFICVSLWACW